MNRDSIASVRKLKDPVTGFYLWQPALVAGQPEQLLGYPIMPAADMPSVAGGALYTAFGDFGAGYTIVSRVSVRVLRDQYTANRTSCSTRRSAPAATSSTSKRSNWASLARNLG